MDPRILRFAAAVALTQAALLVVAVTIIIGAPAQEGHSPDWNVTTRVGSGAGHDDRSSVIFARRIISPDMGIDSALQFGGNGTLVVVTGHVDCDGGESFTIRVTVRQQDGQTSVAHGSTSESCAGAEQTWSAIAESEGSGVFQSDDARACAVGRVDDLDGATFTRRWCVDVVLVEE